ncbi:MAG TPA: xylulokinase, partial [Armatimonadetes bacterium]|nr:xylulokinase [Armatimonadota bacterium]
MAYVLGIDLGTSSTKTLLLSEDGRTVAKATADYPLSTPQPNWVEQDPAAWWEAVCSTVRQVLAAWSGNPRDIAGVGLSGQMNGAVFLNAQGRPLRPAILWLDHRSVAECEWAQEQAGEAIRAAALNPPQPVYSAAKLLWVQRHEPEVWQQARVFLEPKDYVNFLLTGRLGTELTDASATLLLDLRTRQWAVEVWEPLGIRPDLLPELTEATAVIGEVTPTAAAATGLAASTPVVSGGADMACMAVGSGVVSPGVVSVTIGTAGHVTTCAPFVSEAGYNKIYPMCHAVPGQYFWLGCVFSGGLSLQWFRDALGQLEVTA